MKPDPARAHGVATLRTPHSGHVTRGTRAWRRETKGQLEKIGVLHPLRLTAILPERSLTRPQIPTYPLLSARSRKVASARSPSDQSPARLRRGLVHDRALAGCEPAHTASAAPPSCALCACGFTRPPFQSDAFCHSAGAPGWSPCRRGNGPEPSGPPSVARCARGCGRARPRQRRRSSGTAFDRPFPAMSPPKFLPSGVLTEISSDPTLDGRVVTGMVKPNLSDTRFVIEAQWPKRNGRKGILGLSPAQRRMRALPSRSGSHPRATPARWRQVLIPRGPAAIPGLTPTGHGTRPTKGTPSFRLHPGIDLTVYDAVVGDKPTADRTRSCGGVN